VEDLLDRNAIAVEVRKGLAASGRHLFPAKGLSERFHRQGGDDKRLVGKEVELKRVCECRFG
jgi:hypothetical protein